jgi:CBS domain-containing protein
MTLRQLHLADWHPTEDTLHLYARIVGKIRLATTAPRNHWRNVPLYVDVCGPSTRRLHHRGTTFEITFDFADHALIVRAADVAADRSGSAAECQRKVQVEGRGRTDVRADQRRRGHRGRHNAAAADADQPAGIITEADIAHAVADGKDVNSTRIYELMTTRPTVIAATTSVRDAAKVMTKGHFRHLPVVGDAGLVGIVDITDVCLALLASDVSGPPVDMAQPE